MTLQKKIYIKHLEDFEQQCTILGYITIPSNSIIGCFIKVGETLILVSVLEYLIPVIQHGKGNHLDDRWHICGKLLYHITIPRTFLNLVYLHDLLGNHPLNLLPKCPYLPFRPRKRGNSRTIIEYLRKPLLCLETYLQVLFISGLLSLLIGIDRLDYLFFRHLLS